MKTDRKYSEFLPLARLEAGDRAMIQVIDPVHQSYKKREKFSLKYAGVRNGFYEATVVKVTSGGWQLECEEQPLLNGTYTYHYGNKFHWNGIYADEYDNVKIAASRKFRENSQP